MNPKPSGLTDDQRRRWNNRLFKKARVAAAITAPRDPATGLRRPYQPTAIPPPVSWWVGKDRDALHSEVETREQQRRSNRR